MAEMTVEDFCAKLDYEGVEYAFTEYGLSHTMLDRDENPDFYNLVKRIEEKYDALDDDLREVESYIDDYLSA